MGFIPPMKTNGLSIDISFHVSKINGFQMEFRGLANPYSRPACVHWNCFLLLNFLICCCAFSFQPEYLFIWTQCSCKIKKQLFHVN